MNDKEYREFLDAVAKRHLRLHRVARWFGMEGVDRLHYEIDQLSSAARLVHVLEDHPSKTHWYGLLSEELERTYLRRVLGFLDDAGIVNALDEHYEMIFADLSREVIPDEDIAFLLAAGVQEPEAEVTIIIQYTRRLGQTSDIRPSKILQQAPESLQDVVTALSQQEPDSTDREAIQQKPPRYFTGVGRLLSGAITAVGNILLGIGNIPVSGGAAAAAVIASSALAIGLMSQGLGDLRGE